MTLTLLGVLWALMILDREIPLALAYVVLLVLGHYFGARGAQSRPEEGQPAPRPPLFLPRGSIRFIIVLGFAAVGYHLWREGRFDLNVESRTSTIFLMSGALTAGFLVGKLADLLTRGKAAAPRKWFENLKAVVALMATALLAFLSFSESKGPSQENLALLSTPLVVFYFGSRR
jgi:O-antigen ligase